MSITPGQWKVGTDDEDDCIQQVAETHGWIIFSTAPESQQDADSYDPDQDDANANLIAAAPELLESLKLAIDLFEAWRDGIFKRSGISWIKEPPAIVKMRAAIAKAEGHS